KISMRSRKYGQLTPSQEKAVFHTDGPLLVIAGPGSGKTRVITYRIAALIDSGIRPANICAITFTNKAAEEMRERAAGLGASAGAHISTFHSLCVRILRRYSTKANVNHNFSIYDAADQSRCIKEAVKDCGLDSTNFSPARMLEAISTLKNNLQGVESFSADADNFFSKALAMVYQRYQDILNENNALDFDDLLLKTAVLLADCPDVCDELSGRFKYLLIDEYQDTNQAQYRIAKMVASGHRNICVTGDPDQSIYRWRGADIGNILAFESDWPDAVVVKLEENFRSTPGILDAADNLISFNRKRKPKKLIATKPAGKDVLITAFDDEHEEADAVARQIQELISQGAPACDVAVFYRINAMSRLVEEALIKAKIPYQIVRGVEFYARKEIRDVLAYLKILVNPKDEIALLRIINTPARGIGKTTLDRVRASAAQKGISLYEAIEKADGIEALANGAKARLAVFVNMIEGFKQASEDKVAPLVEQVFAESGLERSLQTDGKASTSEVENVNELINTAAEYDKHAVQPGLLDYLQQISLFSDTDSYDKSQNQVALMTLHSAKGLEFENVFIIGLEEGLLPHDRSNDDEDEIEEERRLFFVGMTRAEEGLHISYSRYRTRRGQMLRTIPSQFLYELGIDMADVVQQQGAASPSDTQYEADDEQYDAEQQFFKGQLVGHRQFGLGKVEDFNEAGENSTIIVRFNTGHTKTLMVKYAHLVKITNQR
ncbi:MAG: ATP-dependent helicase, partial [Planctomycetota bacterium]